MGISLETPKNWAEFSLGGFERMCITSSYEERALQALGQLGIATSFVTQRRRPLHPECEDLVSIGLDMFGREQQLERRAASWWQSMLTAAKVDGIVLVAVSGFRSFDYQRTIIERKLAAGLTVEQIVRVSALPGFSEHHTGRAIDIGTPGSPPVTEEFEQTPAFSWMMRRGQDFRFRMTYPKDNHLGVIYEPWHWVFDDPAA
jgi:zinc D-Ala-D-Ala carboxypeptidase